MNIAFDITPAKYITGLITEKGICEPSENSLKKNLKSKMNNKEKIFLNKLINKYSIENIY